MSLQAPPEFASLVRAGGLFPVIERQINGVSMQVFDRPPRTLREVFLSTRDHPGDAVVYGAARWTYGQQWQVVVGLAHRLQHEFGVRKGDRVAIAMRNYPEWIFAFWASQLVGAITVPLNAWLTGPELRTLLAEASPTLLVADQERMDRILSGTSAEVSTPVIGVRSDTRADVTPFERLVDLRPDYGSAGFAEPPDCDLGDEDIATILYTSGTTGQPKGALGSHLNHSASLLNKYIRAVARNASADGSSSDGSSGRRPVPVPPAVKLMSWPLFHISGINTLYTAAYSGHQLVLMHKWDANVAVDLIERERVTEIAGPPFVIRTFVDVASRSKRDLTTLASIGLGGSQAPAKLIQDIADTFNGKVSPRTGYGLTETTSGVIAISGADFVAHPASVGKPLPTVEVAILGEDGSTVPPGLPGEIAIRGPQVVSGYYGQPELTALSFRDGWFRTGDTGRIDAEGFIYIIGRIKDVVIRGGENIHCAEVEALLLEHPEVIEAAAFGVAHPTLGEEVCAAVRVRPGSRLDADDLSRALSGNLAAFKIPAHWAISETPLPRNASGKLAKRELPALISLQRLCGG